MNIHAKRIKDLQGLLKRERLDAIVVTRNLDIGGQAAVSTLVHYVVVGLAIYVGLVVIELDLGALGCEVSAIRRRGIKAIEPAQDTQIKVGDVVVLLGLPAGLAVAEERLLKGL